MQSYIEDLKNIPLFSGIKEKDLKSMVRCIGAYEKGYKKGEFISIEKESVKCIGIVLDGTVHMLKEDLWGNKSILSIIEKGELFGESFTCGNTFIATVSFFAASDINILFLPFKRVMHSCNMSCVFHHRLIENMVTLIADKNVKLMEKLEILSKRTLREKILTYLSLQAQKENSKYITIPMGRSQMADYLCVNRSALTRELSNIKADGLIDYHKNTFHLL